MFIGIETIHYVQLAQARVDGVIKSYTKGVRVSVVFCSILNYILFT